MMGRYALIYKSDSCGLPDCPFRASDVAPGRNGCAEERRVWPKPSGVRSVSIDRNRRRRLQGGERRVNGLSDQKEEGGGCFLVGLIGGWVLIFAFLAGVFYALYATFSRGEIGFGIVVILLTILIH